MTGLLINVSFALNFIIIPPPPLLPVREGLIPANLNNKVFKFVDMSSLLIYKESGEMILGNNIKVLILCCLNPKLALN
jgi:hypothetical protein